MARRMAGEDDKTRGPGKPKEAEDRQARLEQALRANLLKRKEKTRAAKGRRTQPKEGRQT